eukprot:4462283-Prymnesium_polylepis.1
MRRRLGLNVLEPGQRHKLDARAGTREQSHARLRAAEGHLLIRSAVAYEHTCSAAVGGACERGARPWKQPCLPIRDAAARGQNRPRASRWSLQRRATGPRGSSARMKATGRGWNRIGNAHSRRS